jgi:alcohol dehydrogenase
MTTFRALRVHSDDGQRVRARYETLDNSDLPSGEVSIRVAWSSINYKDALAVTGAGRILRRFPMTPGIDLCGTVVESADPRYQPGDAVLCTSYDLGVAHDGGFAEWARVPADWVVPLPDGLSGHDAMALGTAGFTAALAIELMERNDLTPAAGPVLVNGATGGVASLAIDMLAAAGYRVVALTGKPAESGYLRELGAAEVLERATLDFGGKPLEKARWAGAIDSVGGEQLGWLTRTMLPLGTIASVGNAGGAELRTSVFPFILRGVRLLGVDSAAAPMPVRRRVWQRLATDLRPRHLGTIARTIALDEVVDWCPKFLAAQIRGRVVVQVGGDAG